MKRKFIITLILSLIVAVMAMPTSVAFADDQYEYYKINDESVIFGEYDTNTELFQAKFLLPKTYYFKVDHTKGDITTLDGKTYKPVVYNGRNGYVATDDFARKVAKVTSSDLAKLNDDTAYFTKTVLLKKDYVNGGVTIKEGAELAYMGKLGKQAVFYYEGKYINVDANNGFYEPFKVPDHTFPKDNNSNVVTDNSTQNPYNNLLTVILIIGITIPAVAIVFLIFKPVKKHATYDDGDDDYYEDYKTRYNAKRRK